MSVTMFTDEILERIFSNLKYLTEQGDIQWTADKTLFTTTYQEDKYSFGLDYFDVNGAIMCLTPINTLARDMYTYINNKIVAEKLLSKLDEACFKKVINTNENNA